MPWKFSGHYPFKGQVKIMKIIGKMHTDFPEKFGVPRQSGLVNGLKGTIVFEPEFRNPDFFKGIEEYSHIWIIWMFSENIKDSSTATVRPPRLGGNVRKGVFATRSPFRPNPIGLSSVKLEEIRMDSKLGPMLIVSGIDCIDGTPIYDIKPYIPYVDAHPKASESFTEASKKYVLKVEVPELLLKKIPLKLRSALIQTLQLDPRPSYQNDSERIYGMGFSDFEILFRVSEEKLEVVDIKKGKTVD